MNDNTTEMADHVSNTSPSPQRISAGLIGGAGYTGGELIRILINHPDVEIEFIHSKSNAGKKISAAHSDLIGETELAFSAGFNNHIDVLFLCLGHGDAKQFLEKEHSKFTHAKIIDLSHDFRLSGHATFHQRNFVYGLPELFKKEIKPADSVANPGCFATAIQLGLLPLASAGLLGDVYTTGITGATGAGQSLSPATHFSWRANNISAYKTLTHQHLNEILQSLNTLQPGKAVDLSFVPWRGDFARGIFISSQVNCDASLAEVNALYRQFYKDEMFTVITEEPLFLKQAVNTNKCIIQLEKTGKKLVIHSVIDNLIKGASGQAVQNMNLMFGLHETAGLRLKANFF